MSQSDFSTRKPDAPFKCRSITAEDVKAKLHYDPETGLFTRIGRTIGRGAAGSIAGTSDRKGYILICVNQLSHKAHRLAWLYMYGHLPKGEIDHINGVKGDNRIVNLRDVTISVNRQNLRVGVKDLPLGVSRVRSNGRFRASIKKDKQFFSLGLLRRRKRRMRRI